MAQYYSGTRRLTSPTVVRSDRTFGGSGSDRHPTAEITATATSTESGSPGFKHSGRPRRNMTIHNRQRTAIPDDISLASQLILHERQGRDPGWPQQDTFAADAQVRLSWFRGSVRTL